MSRIIKVFGNIYANEKLLKIHNCPTSEEHHQKSSDNITANALSLLDTLVLAFCFVLSEFVF